MDVENFYDIVFSFVARKMVGLIAGQMKDEHKFFVKTENMHQLKEKPEVIWMKLLQEENFGWIIF